jgi:hypothetical protein
VDRLEDGVTIGTLGAVGVATVPANVTCPPATAKAIKNGTGAICPSLLGNADNGSLPHAPFVQGAAHYSLDVRHTLDSANFVYIPVARGAEAIRAAGDGTNGALRSSSVPPTDRRGNYQPM